MAACDLCGAEIDTTRRGTFHRHADGWVSAEGNKAMVLMRTDGRLACNGCIRKLSHGVAPDQQALA